MKRSNYALAIDLLVYIRNRLNQEADKCKRLNKSCPDEKYVYAANLCVQILDDIKREKTQRRKQMKKAVPVTLTLLEFLQLLDQREVHPVKIYSSPKKDDYLILTLGFFHLAKFNRDQKIAAAVGSELLSAHIKTIGLETNNALESMYTVVLDNTQARKGKS